RVTRVRRECEVFENIASRVMNRAAVGVWRDRSGRHPAARYLRLEVSAGSRRQEPLIHSQDEVVCTSRDIIVVALSADLGRLAVSGEVLKIHVLPIAAIGDIRGGGRVEQNPNALVGVESTVVVGSALSRVELPLHRQFGW